MGSRKPQNVDNPTLAEIKLNHRRLFIETNSSQSVARWVEIALTDEFFIRLSELHGTLVARNLTRVECDVRVVWGVCEGWEMQPISSMGMYGDFTYFESTAYPTGIAQPFLGMLHTVSALLFYGSVSEFIELSSSSHDGAFFDEVMVKPGWHEVHQGTYTESTLRAMEADEENDFIACVNAHLLKSGKPALRLPENPGDVRHL